TRPAHHPASAVPGAWPGHHYPAARLPGHVPGGAQCRDPGCPTRPHPPEQGVRERPLPTTDRDTGRTEYGGQVTRATEGGTAWKMNLTPFSFLFHFLYLVFWSESSGARSAGVPVSGIAALSSASSDSTISSTD